MVTWKTGEQLFHGASNPTHSDNGHPFRPVFAFLHCWGRATIWGRTKIVEESNDSRITTARTFVCHIHSANTPSPIPTFWPGLNMVWNGMVWYMGCSSGSAGLVVLFVRVEIYLESNSFETVPLVLAWHLQKCLYGCPSTPPLWTPSCHFAAQNDDCSAMWTFAKIIMALHFCNWLAPTVCFNALML